MYVCHEVPYTDNQFEQLMDDLFHTIALGKPILGLEEEVEFCMAAGYGSVPLTLGFRQIIHGEKMGIMGAKDRARNSPLITMMGFAFEVVPEPGSCTLLAIGGIGLMLVAMRRRRAGKDSGA